MEKIKIILRRAFEKLKTFKKPFFECKEQDGNIPDEYVVLCCKLAELVKMYDQMAKQMPEGETKDLAEDISEQIIKTLSLSKGCAAIANEPAFDSRRHISIPFSMVEDGTPIQSFLRIGIAIGNKVIIPAKVII